MENTLAYYDMTTITAVKSFMVQAPGDKILASGVKAVKYFDGRNL